MLQTSAAVHSLERRNLQNRKRGDHRDPGDQQSDELEERFDRRQSMPSAWYLKPSAVIEMLMTWPPSA
jgi:hypothetical protein